MFIVTSYNDHTKLAHTQCTSSSDKAIKIFDKDFNEIYQNDIVNPAYVYEQNNLIYILTETIDENGQLVVFDKQLNCQKSICLNGKSSCHINEFNNKYIITHYWDGKVEILDKNLETEKIFIEWESNIPFRQIRNKKDHSANRQIGPHCHFSLNFKEMLLIANLGNDIIYVYNDKFEEIDKIQLPKGSGIRNLVKYGDYIYCANELNNTISTIKFENNKFKIIETISICKKGHPSEIKIFKNYLFISVRSSNQIIWYEILSNYKLLQILSIKTGNCPRSFDISQNYKQLIVGSQKGGNVKIYDINFENKNIILKKKIKIESPNCVRFLKLN